MSVPNIKSFKKIVPMIYAYETPGVTYHEGWMKIGYTKKQTVEKRIKQQTHTADIRWELKWQDNAIYKDGSGEYFKDTDFHNYLEIEKEIPREEKTEWFKIDPDTSLLYFNKFANRGFTKPDKGLTYELRQEQKNAVNMTKAYFEAGGTEFLWNAKPRFGKTLTSYDLICQMGFQNVLIVTNRPSIANSWADDFNKFIGWRDKLKFVSDTDALKGKKGVQTREEYIDSERRLPEENMHGMIAFESLQGLKGSVYFGGDYDKLSWMAKKYTDNNGNERAGINFDLLIIDESQEGVDTIRTERAFRNINRKHTLYLSGTPFKALASGQFSKEQIFNWSYTDEQEQKKNWDKDEHNPYEELPSLAMYTYQISNMTQEHIKKGLDLSEENGAANYTFDLNEFFKTKDNGKFVHENEIRKFLHSLTTHEKYPFSTPELRKELSHTLWLLNRVDSCKALYKLLKDDEFKDIFGEYEIVQAFGDGKLSEDNVSKNAYDRVKKAIAENDKTITLSVGQLTVGVTIPEWSGVFMLCNMKSPSAYMQAAFRAQNPCMITVNGERFMKETAYVFDFDPARTLTIFDEFANNLLSKTASGKGTEDDRKENIKKLLNFFPVLGEDDEGKMVELDASAVLSIPRRLKSKEVVHRGFMSNFLFQNISNIFNVPNEVRAIMEKLQPAQEERAKKNDVSLNQIDDVDVDEDGDVIISEEIVIGKHNELFGDKLYETVKDDLEPDYVTMINEPDNLDSHFKKYVDTVEQQVKDVIIAAAADDYNVKSAAKKKIERQVQNDIKYTLNEVKNDYKQKVNIAQAELQRRKESAITQEEINEAEADCKNTMDKAWQSFADIVQKKTEKMFEEKPNEVIEHLEKSKEEEKKSSIEEDVRAHLRGFARTIPSFIMAYGDENLTLANFDDYTEDDVFLEVTGITEEEFRFLRDGGNRTDPTTGEVQHFDCNFFDEVVFNDSIKEFWNKKQELANYFDDSNDEDIFDYIPPQKTNQIFTPRWVVEKMVDELEENNPGCFDNPDNTFADLYMKSGLYITEIVKRLFRSEKMKELFPDNEQRIRHILRKQVYGMAPTRIIYLIATNYILGFDETLKSETKNFVQADTSEASKNGTLEKLVNEKFGC